MTPYRLARVFETPGTDDERLLFRTYELPLPPQRGQDIMLPSESTPRRVARVAQQARPTVTAQAWQPGFAALAWVIVELESEPANQYEVALRDGWSTQ